MWPDVEALAVAYLRTALGVRVSTKLPGNLEAAMPMVRVTRGPGSDDGLTDSPLLDVEVFASNPGQMWQYAEQARQAMHALAGQAVDGVLVDTVDTAAAPTRVDYENPAVERAVASYRMGLRPVRS